MKFFSATCRRWLLWLAGLCLVGSWAVAAESPDRVGEYQVKAAFIYNFTKFTDWPTNAFTSADAPLVIGIAGEDPFGKTMDDVVRGEVVHDRPLVVKRFRRGEDVRSCQVLFIGRSEKDRLGELLGQLKGRPILVVGDTSGFAEQGGTVNFVLVQKTVKMEINQAAAAAAGLRISAKLLKLAILVKS